MCHADLHPRLGSWSEWFPLPSSTRHAQLSSTFRLTYSLQDFIQEPPCHLLATYTHMRGDKHVYLVCVKGMFIVSLYEHVMNA